MLYNINNYFNIQDSGSGISILTGSSLPYYLFTVNGNIKANNIKFNSISGNYGEFFTVTGYNPDTLDTEIPGTIFYLPDIEEDKGSLPLQIINTQNFNGNIFTGIYFSGINFEGNIFNFKENLRAENFYTNLMEIKDFYSFKDIKISGNFYIYNPTGKIENNNKHSLHYVFYSNNNFQPVNPNHNFFFDEGTVIGNDTAGFISFTPTVRYTSINDASIIRIFFTGNYNYNHSPSVIINLINKSTLFNVVDTLDIPLADDVYFVTNVDNFGFDIAIKKSENQIENEKVDFNYLVIS